MPMSELKQLQKLFLGMGSIILILSLFLFYFSEKIIVFIYDMLPEKVDIFMIAPYDVFLGTIKISLVCAILLSLPILFVFIYKYISPALLSKEKKLIINVFVPSLLLSYGGIVFAYKILLPLTLKTLYTYYSLSFVEHTISFTALLDYILLILVGVVFIFNTPIVIWNLDSFGILTVNQMTAYRKYVIVIFLAISAILTPPDVFSMFLMFVPLYMLFEGTITLKRLKIRNAIGDKSV